MSGALTRLEVERIAALASLELTEAEIETFTRQLDQILAYARQVQQIDTAGVTPTSHLLGSRPIGRPDVPQPSLPREQILGAAPDPAAGFFRVPRVIG